MEIYLAGVTGNLSKFWKEVYIQIYIAGTLSRPYVYKQAMELFLAGEHPVKNGKNADWEGLNILETYYYLQKNNEFPRLIENFQNFLLDSGAFTFMSGANTVDFDKYVEGYAAFIKKWNVQNFFKLDIDSVVGIKEVERLRYKLETLTGRKPIPVWHKNRGKEYFEYMCKNYPYVAIGGIVTKEIPINKYEKLFPWFIKTAHKYGCKIHALGYTNIKGLFRYNFDSVDSTAWLYGNMSGSIYKFDARNKAMNKTKIPEGNRLKSKAAAAYNFNEWVRFMKYARAHL